MSISTHAILYPMVALVGLTFYVLFVVRGRRFGAARRDEVRADDFACGESERVPTAVRLANRNLVNLLEMPVLFYAACIVMFIAEMVGYATVALAWAFVFLRVLHTREHIGRNDVMKRMRWYAASNVVLMALWLWVLLALMLR